MIINTTLCCPEEKKIKNVKDTCYQEECFGKSATKTIREKSWNEYVQS